MQKMLTMLFVALIMVGGSGCSTKTTVVLLPDPDGSVGAVSVANEKGRVDLSRPNQATRVKGRQAAPAAPEVIPEKEIEAIFSDVLAIEVSPPVHFLLYFEDNSTELRPDSIAALPLILETIKERNSIDIGIVGHSDTAGNRDYNLDLSRRRAAVVLNLLVDRGIREAHLTTTSHGEENPLVETGDGVSEPRNRRVEVIVR
jgi:outer membrane protein OmpA-like peptidoglycan-associated protein